MPQVTVTIANRTYRMACGEGEEAHLEKLAALFDGKIEEMRGSFGEIGDMRLHVIAALRSIATAGDERTQAVEKRLAESVGKAAERIERLARKLSAPAAASQ
jgi:cell division protein ZapA